MSLQIICTNKNKQNILQGNGAKSSVPEWRYGEGLRKGKKNVSRKIPLQMAFAFPH